MLSISILYHTAKDLFWGFYVVSLNPGQKKKANRLAFDSHCNPDYSKDQGRRSIGVAWRLLSRSCLELSHVWSEQKDSNLRPLDPKSSALPSCAMLRNLTKFCLDVFSDFLLILDVDWSMRRRYGFDIYLLLPRLLFGPHYCFDNSQIQRTIQQP